MSNEEKQHLETLMHNMTIELTQQFQRHVETISENFDLKIGLIAEGQVVLRREMHEIRDELKSDIAHLDFKIDTVNHHLNGRIDKLEGRFDKLEGRFDKLEGRFDKLENKVDGIAADLKAHRADTEAHGGMYRVKES